MDLSYQKDKCENNKRNTYVHWITNQRIWQCFYNEHVEKNKGKLLQDAMEEEHTV